MLALYSTNLFVILTAPFVYAVLENFGWSILGMPQYRFVTAFEPSTLSTAVITGASFIAGPLLLCAVTGVVVLYYTKVKHRTVLCAAVHLLAGYMLIGLLVLWLKVPAISEPPFCFLTFLNYWVMLLHNLTEPWRFLLTIIVTLFFISGMLWSVYRRWRRSAGPAGRLSEGLAAYYRRILFSRGIWQVSGALLGNGKSELPCRK